VDANGRGRVVHRLAGPETATATGSVVLSALDRDALRRGLIVLSLLTRDGKSTEGKLVLP
jgi:hypothetical protein